MHAAPTDLIAYRREKQRAALEEHLKLCHTPFVFFASAYFEYYGCLDRYEVQCCVEQYQRSGEMPEFITAYLKRLQ